MKIDIEMAAAAPGAAEELRKYIEHHVRRSLVHARSYVDRVLVRVMDLNGQKGSFDKLCAVEVRIAGHRPVTVRDFRPDMRAAIARATERAGLISLRRVRQRQMMASGYWRGNS